METRSQEISAGRDASSSAHPVSPRGKPDRKISLNQVQAATGAVEEFAALQVLGNEFGLEVLKSLPNDIETDFTEHLPIGFLKQHKLIPIISSELECIAVNDLSQFQAIDDVRKILGLSHCKLVLAPSSQIFSTINFAYDMTQTTAEEMMQDIGEEDPEQLFDEITGVDDLLDDTSDSPVIRLVNLMFSQAVRDNASDIHIEPYRNSLKVRQRLDGVLYDMLSPPKHVQSALISRVKIMANLNIAEKRLPQDGRIELKIADKEIDVRVSTLPTAFGERVVLRLLRKSAVLISLKEIGMPHDRFEQFEKQIHAPNGIVLVTGPTGSGKTTTLYGALSAINNTDINIITVEDPIEYRLNGIGQVQVNPKIDLTFASGLRSIVRQDPDVILIGEIRDKETAEIAIQSALTGHLVFSTLHTNDSVSAITRLRDMGLESFLLASTVNSILAQRLVRMVCDNCKEAYTPSEIMLERIGIKSKTLENREVYRGKGCSECHYTGYKGRCAIFELLIMSPEMKELSIQTSDANQLRRQALKEGMTTLQESGIEKVVHGITTLEEVYRVTQS